MLVRAKTRKALNLESSYLHKMCIFGPFSAPGNIKLIDLDLQGHFGLKKVNFREIELVRAKTRKVLNLESSYLHKMGILDPFSTPGNI